MNIQEAVAKNIQLAQEHQRFYENTPVLVTGGAGFIGSHLVQALVQQKAQVTVIDDLSTGTIDNLTQSWDKITFIKDSVTNFDACLQATWGKKIVFHLAACTSVPLSYAQPKTCHSSNITGVSHLLEASRINNVERFIFSSSAAVYGNQTGYCHEELLCKPESPYGYSKLIGELLCQEYARLFQINTVMLRYFNVFGDRQDATNNCAGVVSIFKHQLKNNLPITLYGDGMQKRDFVPVSKVVEANLTLGLLAHIVKGEPFNIATGKSITLLELIATLQEEFPGYNQPIEFKAERTGDIRTSMAECSKYKRIITELSLSSAPLASRHTRAHEHNV